MRSILAGLRTLVIPWGASPGSPAIIRGATSVAPPELVAYYAALVETIIGLDVFRLNATQYNYVALIVDPDPALVTGVGKLGTVVELTRQYTFVGQGRFEFTSGIVRIMGASQLDVQSGASVNLLAGSDIDVASGAVVRLRSGSDVVYNVTSMGHGLWGRDDDAANGAAIGLVETTTLIISSRVYPAHRAFAAVWRGGMQATAAGNLGVRVRKTGPAGQQLDVFGWVYPAAQTLYFTERAVFKTGAAAVTAAIALTLQCGGGGTITHIGAAGDIRYLEVIDIGEDSDYVNAPTLV